MIKKDLILGFIIGLVTTILGSYLFITFATDYHFLTGLQIMKSQGNLGKIATLGSILALIAFGIALKINREMIAKGIVLSVIITALFTLFF